MNETHGFFTAGGTLRALAPSYVARPADDELFERLRAGEFCYVLTARQMGKSSLMIRTARRLKAAGASPVLIDLTGIGTGEPDEWYGGLLERVRRELRLDADVRAWWDEHRALGAPQRFAEFLRDVALAQAPGPVAIFIDEIDSTLNLPFRDDFFAAIRAIYNARATEPIYARLSFALLGVATPTDLIQDRERTPFNIGRRIVLQEFSRSDAQPLLGGLAATHPVHADALLTRIFHWTGGHPYLTQKLCAAIAGRPLAADEGADAVIDGLVEATFFSDEGRKDTNITAVQKGVDDSAPAERRRMLRLYRDVYAGKPVAADDRSRAQNYLELYGLVRVAGRRLHVRNLIYRTIFDRQWARAHTPANRGPALAVGASLLAAVIVAAAIYYVQAGTPENRQAELCVQNFNDASSRQEKISALACLYDLKGGQYHEQAQRLFYGLPVSEQRYLFDEPGALGQEFVWVVSSVVATLPDVVPDANGVDYDQDVLGSMINGLAGVTQPNTAPLQGRLRLWKQARALAAQDDYAGALRIYEQLNPEEGYHPAMLYDQAQALIALQRYPEALTSFDTMLAKESERVVPTETPEVTASAVAAIVLTGVTANLTPFPTSAGIPTEAPVDAPLAPTGTQEPTPVDQSLSVAPLAPVELTQFINADRVREAVISTIVDNDALQDALQQGASYDNLLAMPEVASLREAVAARQATAAAASTSLAIAQATAVQAPVETAAVDTPIATATPNVASSQSTPFPTPQIAVVAMTRQSYTVGRPGPIRVIAIGNSSGSSPLDYNVYKNGGISAENPSSTHYYISKGGEITQFVADENTAWHAGRSSWDVDGEQVQTTLNPISIGIRLENRNTGKDPYPPEQYDALLWLTRRLVAAYNIPRSQLVRMLDVAPGRRTDPAGFPWERFVNEVYGS